MLTFILATWRLTSLIHREDGPAHIFEKLRHLLGVRYNAYSVQYATTNLSEGILCFWCSSVWGATVLCSLAALFKLMPWRDVPLNILAASTGAIAIEELLG